MTSDLREQVQWEPLLKPGGTVLCAVSGGLDSMCLLDLLIFWQKKNKGQVVAAHFNHQLRGEEADRDEAFVKEYCRKRKIPFAAGRGNVWAYAAREGLSIEEAGRILRYEVLQTESERLGGVPICTAHHADDNAETMLLNLVRGAGIRGLTGIPRRQGNLRRPLLDFTRAELEEYAFAYEIPHVEDATNKDPDAASRNMVRLLVMPLLRELNPRAAENMCRAAAILTRENAFLEEIAAGYAAHAEPEPEGLRISRQVLTEAPPGMAERVVLRLLESVCGSRRDVGSVDAEAVLALARGREAKWELHLAHSLLVRGEGGEIAIVRMTPPPKPVLAALGREAVFGDWRVCLSKKPGEGASYPLVLPRGLSLTVTAWKRTDRMTLPDSRGERSLKRLFNDAGVRPWRRDTMPVLRIGGAPAAAPGVGVDQAFAPDENTEPVYVTFYNVSQNADLRNEAR